MRRLLVLMMISGISLAAAAEVYRWIDEDGNVIYSDRPHPGAEQLKKHDVQTYEAPSLPPVEEQSPKAAPADTGSYQSVEISVPGNDATIRDNAGNITVVINVSPALRADEGDRLVLYVDGAPFGEPSTSTTFQLSNVDRGTHQLRAAVVDAGGKELAGSKVSSFHLHRTSVLH